MDCNRLGATWLGDGRCEFVVWAPNARTVAIRILEPHQRVEALQPQGHGYFSTILDDITVGARYVYCLDGERERPDPASRYQPEGVHGPSSVVDPGAFDWTDDSWRGVPQDHLVIYEAHIGTFTSEGTFDAMIPHLDTLHDLGVTALELLPVAQFPGAHNWGYDGVFPYAVQNSYGGPDGLRRLVDACHARGLAVLLDCVYNHLGPEGNYLWDYGPYFTDRYHTPWGDAINMDGPWSDEVRRYFIENGIYWMREFHIDGFRLDATDRIIDESATHFLRAFTTAVHRYADVAGRRVVVIAESDANDARYVEPQSRNGYGLDAQWGDDFHHALHALLTGEQGGYYGDFGSLQDMAKAYRQNFVYDGVYSRQRRRTHGNSPRNTDAKQFIVASQNHDQVGNRAVGERLAHLVSFEASKLAAAVVLLSPYVPLVFMGEEYAETAPFQYFTSHEDAELSAAVTAGRRNEFGSFAWQGDVPDPQSAETFERSRLNHELKHREPHRSMLALYRELLRLRRELPALADLNKETMQVVADEDRMVLTVRRWSGSHQVLLIFNFSERQQRVHAHVPCGRWERVLGTADAAWGGAHQAESHELAATARVEVDIAPHAAVVYQAWVRQPE